MKKIIALVTMLCLISIHVLAAVNTAVQEGSVIVVQGIVENKKAGVNVTVVIAKSGVVDSDLISKPLKETVNYIDETNTIAGGEYRFDIYLADNVVDNQIFIKIGETGFITPKEVNYVPVSKIISAINNINNAYAITNTLAQNRLNMLVALDSTYLGLETTNAFEDFTALADKNIVLDKLLEQVKLKKFETSNDELLKQSVADVRKIFKAGVGLAVIDVTTDLTKLDYALNKYSSNLGVDLAEYNALDNGGLSSEKQTVCTVMNEFSISNEEIFKKSIYSGLGIVKINKSISYENVKNNVVDNALFYGIDLNSAKYKSIKNLDTLYKKCAASIPYSGLNNFKTMFLAYIDQTIDEENKPVNTGGTGGASPKGSTTVNTYIPPVIPKNNKFDDVSSTAWSYEAISFLSDKGIINGVGDNKFKPFNNITRAEFVKIIVKAFSLENRQLKAPFEDVKENDWYYNDVVSAYNLGLISGKLANSFAPNEYIIRQDMCVIISKVLELKGMSFENKYDLSFNDENDVDDYARNSIKKLSNYGIINGTGENRFSPKNNATREEVAKIIYTLCK